MPSGDIQKVPPPALPQATEQYNRPYQDQLNNVQRLFYNRLTQAFNSLISPPVGTDQAGGSFLHFPYGEYMSTATQSVAVINTPTKVLFDTNNGSSGMYFVGGDGVHFIVEGRYNVQFSVQLTNTDNQAHDMALWLRKNGTDIAWTDSVITVPGTHGGQPGYNVLAANFSVTIKAGDYLEFWWASNSLQVQMNALPAITVPFAAPGAPSFVTTISFISSL